MFDFLRKQFIDVIEWHESRARLPGACPSGMKSRTARN
jgi:hypothetical protein